MTELSSVFGFGTSGTSGTSGAIGTSGTGGTSGTSGSSGSRLTWVITSDSTTNVIASFGYFVDARSNDVTLLLPSSPSLGDEIGFSDYYKQALNHNIIVDPNGKNIEGSSENVLINVSGATGRFVYSDSARGWKFEFDIIPGETTSTTEVFDYSKFVDRGDPAAYDFSIVDLTTNEAWHILNFSSIAPSNAIALVIKVHVRDDVANSYIQIRKNGNSDIFATQIVRSQVANIYNDGTLVVACDENQTIEYLASNTAFLNIYVQCLGWFTDDASALSSGYKNKIINGNFDIWQRGTSGFTTQVYSADRWYSDVVGHTNEVSQQTFTVGQTDVPNEPEFYLEQDITVAGSAASDRVKMVQKIENVRTLAGKTITASFYAKCDSTNSIVVEFYQNFGDGGSESTLDIGYATFPLTTSWQKISYTLTLPSISGKTIGTDSHLGLNIWICAGSSFDSRTGSLGFHTGTYHFAQVQVEEGSVATNFEQRHISQERSLCYAYYYEHGGGTGDGRAFGVIACNTTSQLRCEFTFPVPMRTGPTVTWNNEPFRISNVSTYYVDFSIAYFANKTSLILVFNNATGFSPAHGEAYMCDGHTNSGQSSERSKLIFDAEL